MSVPLNLVGHISIGKTKTDDDEDEQVSQMMGATRKGLTDKSY